MTERGFRRVLLLQVREPGDPAAAHERAAFRRALGLEPGQLQVFDLLAAAPAPELLEFTDAVLIGGSGDHSVVRGGPWLAGALDAMETLHDRSIPTFASCWGFQALAAALGGRVITDRAQGEIGVLPLHLTEAGHRDPLFGPLGSPFSVVIGHEDIVTDLPPDAVRLASSDTVANEAFRFRNRPIWATQFHPEVDRDGLVERVARYPAYLELTGFDSLAAWRRSLPPVAPVDGLLRRFATEVAGRAERHRPDAFPPRPRHGD